MEEGETASVLARRELRKQKLMEYLKAKGKLRGTESKPNLQRVSQVRNPGASSLEVMGKENSTTVKLGNEQKHTAKSRITGVSRPGKQSQTAFNNNIHTKNTNSKFGTRSTATLPCPAGPVSSRISFGPLVKTKTGLVPVVSQPGQTQRHTSVTEKDATRSFMYKPRHSTSATASKSSNSLTNKRRLPVLKSTEEEKTTVPSITGSKIQARAPKSELRFGTNGQQHAVPSRTSMTGIVHRTKDEQGQKKQASTKGGDAIGCGSAHVRPQQRPVVAKPARPVIYTNHAAGAEVKAPGAPIPPTDGKKQTRQEAQAERMKKLQEWREANGISYKRPPMPVKPQARRSAAVPKPFWAAMKDEDEAHTLICAVDRSLADCVKLLGEGCPPAEVKAVLARLPEVARKFTKYWICQARLMEREGNLDVLPLFEEAVSLVLEPVDELRTVVFDILKKKDEARAQDDEEERPDFPAEAGETWELRNAAAMTPKPVRALICGEKGASSVVKYKITATPGRPPKEPKEPPRVNGQEVRFFTPVRRSVRIERASQRYPASLQDHDLCVASYSDLMSKGDGERIDEDLAGEASPPSPGGAAAGDSPMYVYRENDALKDKVLVKLVYEEEP